MHMADALISPSVCGTLWVVSGGLIAFCAQKVKQTLRDNLVPMMGVLGAFIFAAQMINISIPGTGSSGHLGGGLILTVLLGPYAAFLVISSVLTVQAFFFADGGLLALGCNIFNLGFFPAFVAYPLIYRVMTRGEHGTSRAWVAAIIAAVVGLQLGAFCVVLETTASGISELPFRTFVLMMLPVHVAIGVVEGLATAAVVSFVARARPEALATAPAAEASVRLRPVLIGLVIATVIMGSVASWFASTHPDGLEWSIAKVTGKEEISGSEAGIHKNLAHLQNETAFLPDYGFKANGAETEKENEPEPWPSVNAGTSLSGIVGGLLTLALAGLVGFVLKARSPQRITRPG
jgi:cobalt/nickel transport system permease protein